MSLESVKAFLRERAPDVQVIETSASTATVALAAAVHGVSTAQIAKTLSLRVKDEVVLVVMGGDARLDNRKFKSHFGSKAKMLDSAEVLALTGHPVGGVCPFALPQSVAVFADLSLRAFDEVVPAAGAANAAVRIAPQRMAELVGASWIDVSSVAAVD